MFSASEESPPMFESKFIDAFSRVPWFVVPLIYVPLITAFVATGLHEGAAPWAVPLQIGAGIFVWTLLEYWLHRTLFHWQPDTWWGPRMHFILHGVHHQWFKDRFRLVMPPAVSLGLAVVFFGITWAIGAALSPFFSNTWVWAFFGGLSFGYLMYDMVHYYTHHGRPRSRMMKRLRAHHMAHHHNPKFKDKKYGVSNTLWDHVFGTYS